jgi:hypothetical protein
MAEQTPRTHYDLYEGTFTAMFRNMAYNCEVCCDKLIKRAFRSDRLQRHLQVASGLMALISGLCTTAVFTELLGGVLLKIIAALLAFVSGALTLILTSYLNQKESDDMFEGYGLYIKLRDKFWMASINTKVPEEEQQVAWLKYSQEFADLSARYGRYIGH